MDNGILGGGIIVTMIISFWDNIRRHLWKFAEFFICRYEFNGNITRYGAAYIWDSLKNRKSLSPIYEHRLMGSGNDAKLFIREIGFRNFRLVFFWNGTNISKN